MGSLVAAGAELLGSPAAAQGPAVIALEVSGGIDPPGRIEEYVAHLAPLGSPYVEAGDADREGLPISTVGRLRQALGRIGYAATIEPRPHGGGVRLVILLRAYDRIRHLFVRGNWPLRQDQILRRISVRPGQALPPAGPEREQRLEVERVNIVEFLRGQGYLDADVRFELEGTKTVPSQLALTVHIKRGPPYPIGPIAIRGNTAVPSNDIEDELRHNDWRLLWLNPLPYRLSIVREDIAALTERYRNLGYAGARLAATPFVDRSLKHVRLDVLVGERKHIDVSFEGNRRVSSDRLRERLTLFARGAYDDYEATQSASALAQFYRERGHMLVQVTWRRERLSPSLMGTLAGSPSPPATGSGEPDRAPAGAGSAPAPTQSERIVFVVDEGPVLRVRGVEFVGNRWFAASALADAVNVRKFPLLGALGLGQGGYASLRQLATDVDNLVVTYREAGFPEARVRCEIAPSLTPSAWRPLGPLEPDEEPAWRAAHALYVRFVIEEGVRVSIGDIHFEPVGGGDPLPRDNHFLRDSLLTKVGDSFRPALVREDVERLRRVFGDEGYPEAVVDPNVARSFDRAVLTWRIKLGPRIRVGPLFVRGNFFSRQDTITQWVPLSPGSVLTTTAVERGQRNLALIQLFNNASPLSFPSESPSDPVVPMVIEVEERHDHWGVLRLGGGASTEQLAPDCDLELAPDLLLRCLGYGSVGYEHRNLFGRGWTFLTLGTFGNSVTRAQSSVVDPRLFGTLFRLELSASYLRQSTARLGDIRSGGGSIGFAREMYPGVDAAVRYNLRDTLRTEFLLRGAGPDEEQRTVQIRTVVGSLSLTVEWQRLDHPLAPTRGFKVTGGVELALRALSAQWGQDQFLKAFGKSLTVVPLLPWLSLRHSIRYDHGFPFGAPVLPKVERFFAGGDNTIRGFELDRARAETIASAVVTGCGSNRDEACVSRVQYFPIGGSVRVLHNVDLQFPITGIWHGAVFLDTGIVADSPHDLAPARFRHGVGVSPLLIKLPIGDISLSWGWPLDPQSGDARIGRLHFNVGLMF